MISETTFDYNFGKMQQSNQYYGQKFENTDEAFSYYTETSNINPNVYEGGNSYCNYQEFRDENYHTNRPLQDITAQCANRAPFGDVQNHKNGYNMPTGNYHNAHVSIPYEVQHIPTEVPFWQQGDENSCGSTYQHHRLRTNRRKRERNMNINSAFDSLRNRIPNLPNDTKISKIRILQLACEYIRHLDETLQEDDKENNMRCAPFDDVTDSKIDPSLTFTINPTLARGKRKRIDWDRIQDEIQRHETHQTSAKRRNTSSTASSSPATSSEE